MQDAWRAYLELALGLTEASRKKAEQVARDLVGKGGATAAQLQAAAEELLSTSRTNREGMVKLVRYEVDRALGAVGLATADEVAELTSRIRKLEREIRESPTTGAQAGASAPTGQAPPTTHAAATSSAAMPATRATKSPAKVPAKTPAKKTVRKQPAKQPAKRPAKKAPRSSQGPA